MSECKKGMARGRVGVEITRRENGFLEGSSSVEPTRDALVWMIPIPRQDAFCLSWHVPGNSVCCTSIDDKRSKKPRKRVCTSFQKHGSPRRVLRRSDVARF